MIAKVIPHTFLPRKMAFLDYCVPKILQSRLKKGHLVRIPLKTRILDGIVCDIDATSDASAASLKEIIALLHTDPIISEANLLFINELSEYCFTSPSVFLKNIIPRIPKRIFKAKETKIVDIDSFFLERSTSSELEKFIDEHSREKTTFTWYKNMFSAFELLAHQLTTCIKTDGNALVLFPSIPVLEWFLAFLHSRNIIKGVISLEHTVSHSAYWEIWNAVRSQKAKVIISTKIGLFLPFIKLDAIYGFDFDSDDYKQADQNPHYDARFAMMLLSERFNANFHAFAQTMPIAWSQRLNEMHCHEYSMPQETEKTRIIDYHNEWKRGEDGFIGHSLATEMEKTLQNDKKVILYVSRNDTASMVRCNDCQYIFACPRCLRILSKKGGMLICKFCAYERDFPLSCDRCKGVSLHQAGINAEKIATEARMHFPAARTVILDKESYTPNDFFGSHIIVISKYVYSLPLFSKDARIGLFSMMHADHMLASPHYRASEKCLFDITHAVTLANTLRIPLLLHTFSPDHALIEYAIRCKQQSWMQQELDARKRYLYPPFSFFIHLIYRQRNAKKITYEVASLQKKFMIKPGIDIKGPFPMPQKFQKSLAQYFIVRCKSTVSQKDLDDFLDPVMSDWIIDRDPV